MTELGVTSHALIPQQPPLVHRRLDLVNILDTRGDCSSLSRVPPQDIVNARLSLQILASAPHNDPMTGVFQFPALGIMH